MLDVHERDDSFTARGRWGAFAALDSVVHSLATGANSMDARVALHAIIPIALASLRVLWSSNQAGLDASGGRNRVDKRTKQAASAALKASASVASATDVPIATATHVDGNVAAAPALAVACNGAITHLYSDLDAEVASHGAWVLIDDKHVHEYRTHAYSRLLARNSLLLGALMRIVHAVRACAKAADNVCAWFDVVHAMTGWPPVRRESSTDASPETLAYSPVDPADVLARLLLLLLTAEAMPLSALLPALRELCSCIGNATADTAGYIHVFASILAWHTVLPLPATLHSMSILGVRLSSADVPLIARAQDVVACVPAMLCLTSSRNVHARARAACWGMLREAARVVLPASASAAAIAVLALARAVVTAAPPIAATDVDQSVLATFQGARTCVDSTSTLALLKLCIAELDVRPAAAATLATLVADAVLHAHASSALTSDLPPRCIFTILDTCRDLIAQCMKHSHHDTEASMSSSFQYMPTSVYTTAKACIALVRTILHASSLYASAPDRAAISAASLMIIHGEILRGVVELRVHEDISPSLPSSPPTHAWLSDVLDAVDASVWDAACVNKVKASRGAGEQDRVVADALLDALIERIRTGPAGAASACRHVLARVSLPAALLLRFMHRVGVIASRASSSAAATHTPAFNNASVVRDTLQPLEGKMSAFTEWVMRATILAETLTAALRASATAVPGIDMLMQPLFALVESLSAAPHVMPMLAGSRAGTAGTPQRGGKASTPLAAPANHWEDDDTTSSIEYAKQMLLSLVHHVADAAAHAEASVAGSAADIVTALRTHADVDLVLHCIHGDVSTQTRSAALLLLGSLASLLPQQVLGRLMPALAAVGSVAVAREDGYSLSVVQRLVETVVPALRRHGAHVGVTLHSLLDVFSRYFFDIPTHRRKNVFGTLLRYVMDDAGAVTTPETDSSRYAPSLTAFLLRQHTLHGDKILAAAGASGAKASVPDVCMSVLHRFTPTQQLRALSQLLHVSSRLFAPAGEVVVDADAAMSDDVSDVEELEGAAAARVEHVDVDALLPPLVHTSVESDAVELTSGQRFDLGLNIISFTVAHLSSKPFVNAALSAAAAVTGTDDGDASAAFNQQYYLLFAERLFDLLAVASQRLRAAGRDVTAATRHAEGMQARAVEMAAAAARAPRATDGGAAVTAARNAAQDAARQQAGFAVVQTFWQRANKELFAALSHLSVLLDPAAFVTVITTLLQHEDSTVQRHSLAFFTEYLRSNHGDGTGAISESETLQYLTLVEDLVAVLQPSSTAAEADDAHARDTNRQIALDTLATLARYFARGHPDAFEPALAAAVDVLRDPTSGTSSLPVVASAMLCFAALTTHMGPRIVALLPTALTAILRSLEIAMPAQDAAGATEDDDNADEENPVTHVYALRLAALAALRIVTTQLPAFMHAYLPRIFAAVLHPRIAGADVVPSGAWRPGRSLTMDDILASLTLPWRASDAASLDITGMPTSAQCEPLPLNETILTASQTEAIRASAVEVLAHVATHVPMRTLLPALLSSIEGLKRMSFTALRQGMIVLHATIHRATKAELREHIPALFRFFLAAFDLRWMRVDADSAGHMDAAHTAGSSAPSLPSTAVTVLNGISVYGAVAEAATVDAFVAMALKLSESQLRPVLLKMLQWANADAAELVADVEIAAAEGVMLPRSWSAGAANPLTPGMLQFALLARRIVLHRVLGSLALILRSLFMPMFSYVLPDAARELAELTTATNAAHTASVAAVSASKPGKRGRDAAPASGAPTSKKAAPDAAATTGGRLQFSGLFYLDACVWNPVEVHDDTPGVWGWAMPTSPHALRCACLQTLRCSFAADTAQEPDGFMSKAPRERLDTVLSPLVEQFKLPLVAARSVPGAIVGIPGGNDGYRSFVRVYLLPCVGDLLIALRKDTLWKPLHSALTLLAVHTQARVRLAALQALRVVHERGGEDALLLMPEAFPCLSECVRDDDTHVQAEANKLVRMLEEKSGEDLQTYLA